MSTIKVNTVKPVTSGGSLTIQGDSGGSGVTALTCDSSGNTTVNSGKTVTLGSIVLGGTNFNLADQVLQRPTIKDYAETGNAIGNTSSSQTIDIADGNVITATLAVATTTFTFSNPSTSGSGCSFTLILTQDGTGSRAVTWPASVDWASATAPTLSTGAADVDIFAFITVDAGTTWYGFTAGQDMG